MGQIAEAMKSSGIATAEKAQGTDVLCEIVSIGEAFGFAETTETTETVEAGQKVYLPRNTCAVLVNNRNGAWGAGSSVVLALVQNNDPEKVAETPWVGVFAKLNHTRNTRVAPTAADASSSARMAEQLLSDTTELVSQWASFDPAKTDVKARKALTDLVNATKAGNFDAAKSAFGRLRTRVAELLAPAAAGEALEEMASQFEALLGTTE